MPSWINSAPLLHYSMSSFLKNDLLLFSNCLGCEKEISKGFTILYRYSSVWYHFLLSKTCLCSIWSSYFAFKISYCCPEYHDTNHIARYITTWQRENCFLRLWSTVFVSCSSIKKYSQLEMFQRKRVQLQISTLDSDCHSLFSTFQQISDRCFHKRLKKSCCHLRDWNCWTVVPSLCWGFVVVLCWSKQNLDTLNNFLNEWNMLDREDEVGRVKNRKGRAFRGLSQLSPRFTLGLHTHTHAHACTHIHKHMHTYVHTHGRRLGLTTNT